MSLSTFVGTFAKRTGTGTQAITGVGFQPKAVIFWWNNLSATGFSDNGARISIGFDDGTNHIGFGTQAQDNVGTSDTDRVYDNTKSLLLYNLAETLDSAGAIQSMDADGFTINWSSAFGSSGATIHYMAIGGSGISCKVGEWTSSASTGNDAVTGVGFRPDLVFFFGAGWTTSSSNNSDAWGLSVGVSDAFTRQASFSTVSQDNVGTSVTYRYQRSDECIASVNNGALTVAREATFVGSQSDGFTVNWTTAVAGKAVYLAVAGVAAKVGTVTQPTSTGNQAITGLGFQPSALWMMSSGKTAGSSVVAENQFSFGAASGSNQGAAWGGDNDNKDTMEGARYDSTSTITIAATPATNGASSTKNSEASLSSFDSDGFTLNWGTADATQREFIYVAMATGSTPDPSSGHPAMRRWGGSIWPTGARRIGRGW